MFSKDIGIDLGTASILVYVKGKGVVLREPSVVAIDKNTGKLLKVGTEAQQMLGRTPGNIVAIRPLREGVISDYDMTERMLKEFIRKVTSFRLFKPRIVICVPSGITEVEERAVIDAGIQAGARRVYLIEEPVAAAIGAGIDIAKPDGHMIVDIGGGTTDIAVISLSGIVESTSIKIAGDQFDEAIVKYIRRKHNVLIGERTAEELKMQIGCVFPRPEEQTVEIKGRCLMTGLPRVFSVSSSEMIEAFEEVSTRILEAIHGVLERTPPELVADISTNGIVMTGGGSLIRRHIQKRRHFYFIFFGIFSFTDNKLNACALVYLLSRTRSRADYISHLDRIIINCLAFCHFQTSILKHSLCFRLRSVHNIRHSYFFRSFSAADHNRNRRIFLYFLPFSRILALNLAFFVFIGSFFFIRFFNTEIFFLKFCQHRALYSALITHLCILFHSCNIRFSPFCPDHNMIRII